MDESASIDLAPISASRSPDFSLVLGGPLYQLLLRVRMVRPTMELLPRRIGAAVVITWLPLALLTLIGGTFRSGPSVPFVFDLDAHVRFLLALPLLIAAEVVVHRLVRAVVDQFRERDLIAPQDRPTFDAIVSGAMRLRNSVAIEVVLLVSSFTVGYWLWRSQASLDLPTWYGASVGNGISFTPAGYWYVFISIPIFRFIILRWYFRLFIWYAVLFRISRLRLQLNALHPDRAGGLEFLTLSAAALAPVFVAQTVFLAGVIGDQIWEGTATVLDFKFVIGGYVAFLILVALLPLVFFAPRMALVRQLTLREYGAFAARYTNEFREKWLEPSKPGSDDPLGTGDIQSLADLANSYDVARGMRIFPFTGRFVVQFAIMIALPLLPLFLTMVPLETLLQQVIKIIL